MSSTHVSIDEDDPHGVAICDASGFVVPRRELVKQMEWRGDRLVWTGLMVWSKFADVPNESLREKALPPDPPTISGTRPDNQFRMPHGYERSTPFRWETTPLQYYGTQG